MEQLLPTHGFKWINEEELEKSSRSCQPIIIIITFVNKADVLWSFSVILSDFCHAVNRITDERGNGRRPNLAGTGNKWPSRSGWLLVVIRICAWIPVFQCLRHWEIFDFPTFVSNSLFSTNLAKWMTPTNVSTVLERYSTDIRIQINPKIRIRIRITFVSNFGVGVAKRVREYWRPIESTALCCAFVLSIGRQDLNLPRSGRDVGEVPGAAIFHHLFLGVKNFSRCCWFQFSLIDFDAAPLHQIRRWCILISSLVVSFSWRRY